MRWALLVLLLLSPVSAQDAPPPEVTAALKQLKSGKEAERIAALGKLENLADKANGAAPQVIETLVDKSPDVQLAASACLAKIAPDIHKPIFGYLIEKKTIKSVEELGKLGPKALAAVPFLKKRINAGNIFENVAILDALVAIAPKDQQVVDEVLRRVALQFPKENPPRISLFDFTQFKQSGFKNLDKIETTNEKRAKVVVAAMGTDLAGKKTVELIEMLGNYGPDAKVALPLLAKYRVHPNQAFRDAATKAVEAINKKD